MPRHAGIQYKSLLGTVMQRMDIARITHVECMQCSPLQSWARGSLASMEHRLCTDKRAGTLGPSSDVAGDHFNMSGIGYSGLEDGFQATTTSCGHFGRPSASIRLWKSLTNQSAAAATEGRMTMPP